MLDILNLVLVSAQPRKRTNRSRNKQKTIRVTARRGLQRFRQKGCQHHPREIVIAERGVTTVARNQNFVGGFAGQKIFAVRQMPRLKRRINAYLVLVLCQTFEQAVRYAETPILAIVRGAIRNPIRLFENRREMRFEFCERNFSTKRRTVIEDVQIRLFEINNLVTGGIFDVRVADIPFVRHSPIQDLRSGRHLMDFNRNLTLKNFQRFTKAIAGDAAANRIQL